MKNKMMLLLALLATSASVVVATAPKVGSDVDPVTLGAEYNDEPSGRFAGLKNRYDHKRIGKKGLARNIGSDVLTAAALGLTGAELYKGKNFLLNTLLNNTRLGNTAFGSKYLRRRDVNALVTALQAALMLAAAQPLANNGSALGNAIDYGMYKSGRGKYKRAPLGYGAAEYKNAEEKTVEDPEDTVVLGGDQNSAKDEDKMKASDLDGFDEEAPFEAMADTIEHTVKPSGMEQTWVDKSMAFLKNHQEAQDKALGKTYKMSAFH